MTSSITITMVRMLTINIRRMAMQCKQRKSNI